MSKASSHFINNGRDDTTNRRFMTCKYCFKKLVNSGNTNCFASHLSRCRPDLEICNKIRSLPKRSVPVQIQFADSPMRPTGTNFLNEISMQTTTSTLEYNTPIKKSSVNTPIKTFLLSKTPYSIDSTERLKLIDSLINCIVKLNLPLSIVDADPFIKFISDCNNKFSIPCRQTLTKKLIPEKARQGKKELQILLDTVKYCSLTCDGWTSEAGQSYLGNFCKFDYQKFNDNC